MSQRRTTVTLIDGVEVGTRDIRTRHSVDRPVATGSVVLRTPRPWQAEPGAPVAIYAGYDGATQPIFSGRVAEGATGYDQRGSDVTVQLEGWAALLYSRYHEGRGFAGPVPMDMWWRTLCSLAGVPRWRSDIVSAPDGTPLALGDNPDYRGGWIPIEPNSPGRQIDRVVGHFGYRSFDTPLGMRLQRVGGLPTEAWETLPQYVQGVNIEGVTRTDSGEGVVNAVDIRGATYPAPDGAEVALRSFTGEFEPDPRFGATGLAMLRVDDSMLGSQALCDAARAAYEIDRAGTQWRYQWTAPGDPARIPGEQVALQSGIVNGSTSTDPVDQLIAILPRPLWLMAVEHAIPETGGWTTTLEGWAGLGQALPAGNDCVTQTIMAGSVHLGNETLSHYRHPAPIGAEHNVDFTVPDTFTTATIRGIGHGANSFVRNQESTASRFELWQGGERVASGELPRQAENLERRLPYGNAAGTRLEDGSVTSNPDYFWSSVVVPLTGRLDPGAATLKILSGRDSAVGDYDDFEIGGLAVTFCGVGEPVPVEGD